MRLRTFILLCIFMALYVPLGTVLHIAIQENLDGKVVDWMEQVTDTQYHG